MTSDLIVAKKSKTKPVRNMLGQKKRSSPTRFRPETERQVNQLFPTSRKKDRKVKPVKNDNRNQTGRKRSRPPSKKNENSKKKVQKGNPLKQRKAKKTKDKTQKAKIKASPETVEINNAISFHANRKQLSEAVSLYEKAVEKGLANSYTYSNIINAYVRCGNTTGAIDMLKKYKNTGTTPDIISYTTVLKGMCGDLRLNEAKELLKEVEMKGLKPNIRTVNTLLRGCIFSGDIKFAEEITSSMQKKWKVDPDVSSKEYIIALFCRGLCIDKATTLVKNWKTGSELEDAVHSATLSLCVGRAATLLGEWKIAKNMLKATLQLLEKASAPSKQSKETQSEGSRNTAALGGKRGWGERGHSQGRTESLQVFRKHRQEEMKKEASELLEHVSKKAKVKLKDLPGIENMTSKQKDSPLIFQVLRSQNLMARMLQVFLFPSEKMEQADSLCQKLEENLLNTFGLERLIKRSFCTKKERKAKSEMYEQEFKNKYRKRINTSQKLEYDFIFSHAKRPNDEVVLPTKLEVCSGTGDWVVAQAKADEGKANWMSLEMRHDRVHETFTKAVMHNVSNLGILCGDATKIVPNNIKLKSIDKIFVNYPEPPQKTGGYESQSRHLLTADFFKSMANALKPNGVLTVITDNMWYGQLLLHIVSETSDFQDALLSVGRDTGRAVFDSVKVAGGKSSVLNLYEGPPCWKTSGLGEKGKMSSSYFDRLWRREKQTKRYLLCLIPNYNRETNQKPVKNTRIIFED